ncbi:MAG: UvrD-helicase domain-containing protein [Pseudorhodoplanes sp.]
MNAFEAIRKAASRLHYEVVAKAADPNDPSSLVAKAIKHLDLEVCYLATGNTALKGARAVFDDQSGTICCENTGSPAERAQLVAHEIGHATLHSRTSCCSGHDIDPSRSTESAPVGLQKVEDYGARERRELEANVFAREFLFPRSRARRLHAEECKGAKAIADALGLPIPLVRQQILDALLLPEFAQEPEKPKQPYKEDPAQETAALQRGKPFQLKAGPGTGKTHTLVRRIETLLAEGVHPPSIVILTFSNRTAGELVERLNKALGEETASSMWVGTFHGFGLDIVRRYHDKLDLPPDPTLFDRSDAIAVLEEILPTLPLDHYKNLWDPVVILREILQAISRAKDELVSAPRYRELAQAMRDKAGEDPDAIEAAEKCLEIATIYGLYEQAKRKKGAVDFGDLIMLPARLITDDPSVQMQVRLRHRHVVVDEYQDVNRASVLLVKALAGDGGNLWVVGDARQSIYRFRGASSANMAAFADDFPSMDSGQLEISYRSTQKIISIFGDFASGMDLPADLRDLTLAASRGEGMDHPEMRVFVTPDEEAAGIAASVRDLEKAGVKLRDQAILCRANRRLNEIAKALEDRGIPVLHLGSLFERDEIRDLLSILTLAVDRYGAGLVRIGAMPRYDIPAQDVKKLIDHVQDGDKPVLTRLDELTSVSGLSAAGVAGVTRLAADLKGAKTSGSPWDVLTTLLLDRTDIVKSLSDGADIGARMRAVAVWQFLNFLRDQSPVPTGTPIQTMLDRVRNLVLLAEERDLRQVPDAALQMDAVRLMTIHGSKGLEFEAVHIPGMTVASIPGSNRGTQCPPPEGMIAGSQGSVSDDTKRSHAQEEECLFFVAMSRARTHLRLYRAEKQANGDNRKPSPYLDRIAGKLRAVPSPAMLPLPAGFKGPEPVQLTIPSEWVRTHDRIKSYDKCPRRFLYTHVFGLGTARRTTPFDRTHGCIYEFIDWLAKQRVDASPTLEVARAAFKGIWDQRGPTDHAFAKDYFDLGDMVVEGLIKAGAGRTFRECVPLAINYRNGTIIVEPDEIAERADGVIVVRKVRTGKRGKSEFDKLEYALYQKAAADNYGTSAVVEAVHPSDVGVEEVPALTKTKAKNRETKTEEILNGIMSGAFKPLPEQFTCPRCPHFFICAATPRGPLKI